MLLLLSLYGFTSCLGHSTGDESQDITMNELLTRVMVYIEQNHPDTAEPIPEDISWIEVSRTKKIGYTRYVFQGNGWTVSIGLATTAEPSYEVTAENNAAGITWTGTIKNNTITETGYTTK